MSQGTPRRQEHGPALEAAVLDAIGGVPVHMMVAGHAVVLVGARQFRSLVARHGPARIEAKPGTPITMAELETVLGAEAAATLVNARRYRPRAVIPATAAAGHWLARMIGQEAADKLCLHVRESEAKGATLILPEALTPARFYAEARRRAVEMTARGLSISTIARRLNVSTRVVEKWRGKAKSDSGGTIPSSRNRSAASRRNRIEHDV